jgi:hypothetical protein
VKVSEGFEWAYRDLLIALLVVFMAMAALALVAATKATRAGVTQGDLVITIDWRGSPAADVDAWVLAPGDAPVGFHHPSDAHCNLLRDDLGRDLDPASMAQEEVVCRAAPAGEYVVDAMLYQLHSATLPVGVAATVLRISGGGVETLLTKRETLTSEGEQATIWRFTLDAKGHLVPGSVNDLPMALYAGAQ